MTISYSMTGKAPSRILSVTYPDGDMATIPESHEQFQRILDLTISGGEEEEIRDLVNIVVGAGRKLRILSERVSLKGNKLLFDGDPIHGTIVDAIVDLAANDSENLPAAVNFLEKVKTNPSVDSIHALWDWLNNRELHFAPDGDFFAYKMTEGYGENRTSIHSGTAYVNGEEVTGKIPNPDGAVVTMARSSVDADGTVHCSTGLHAATHRYATGTFSNRGDLILVKINPRDVVSVPHDESFRKLRVCRYVVVGPVSGRLDESIYIQPTLEEEPDEDGLDTDEEPDYFEDDHVEEEIGEDEAKAPEGFKFGDLVQQPTFSAINGEDGTLTVVGPVALTHDQWREEHGFSPLEEKGVPLPKPEEAEKPAEKPQEPLRQPNGRFTKAGALYEAKAAQRDALGRFKKNA